MNKEEIQRNRLWNFRQIIKNVGGTNEAARIMSKKNSYITQIAGPSPKRNIGDKKGSFDAGQADQIAAQLVLLAAAIRSTARQRLFFNE